VGVAGKSIQVDDFRPFVPFATTKAHGWAALEQLPPRRPRRLVADQSNRAARVVDIVAEMLKNPAAFAHAARRDQDTRLATPAQVLTLIASPHVAHRLTVSRAGHIEN